MIVYLKKKIYEDRLGKFTFDILSVSKIFKLFGWFPAIALKTDHVSNAKCRVFDWWSLSARVIRIASIILTLNVIIKSAVTLSDLEKFLVFQTAAIILSMEICYIVTAGTFPDLLNSFNDFDRHAKTLQTKCKLMKVKYSRYIWTSFVLVLILAISAVSAIENFRLNTDNKTASLYTAYYLAVTVSFVVNSLSQIYLLTEIRSRVNLLENSFSEIFKGIITSSSDAVLLKLHVDKYGDLHRKLWPLTKHLADFRSSIMFMSICRWYTILLFSFWRFYSYRTPSPGIVIFVLINCSQLFITAHFSDNYTDIVSIL